ncbi:MAG: trypsin-like peptidase domain-containing protein [Candidatus Lloydbacteria bacterium]|nr:trypsin-like peptidase domain-containing protein [Candidatus Lloydbacteria bacterium]
MNIADASGSLKALNHFEKELVSLAETALPTVVSLSPYVPPSPSVLLHGMPDGSSPVDHAAGVIVDGENGYIVTNSHVVRGVGKIQVTLHSGEKIIGRVAGVDEDTDLALIKIDTDKKLSSAVFGDSNSVKVGQLVIAIGNPFGLNNTLTMGIVSGLNRGNLKLSKYESFIQTDAPINPGNSGGPLFNIDGEIVGINTAIINYAQGIGFAIPSNTAKRILAELIKFGEVRRGWLGIEIEPVSRALAIENLLTEDEGVLINAVVENSPAAHAQIQVNSILLKIDGVSVNSPSEVVRIIGSMVPGKMVHLGVLLKGEYKIVSVVLTNSKK